MARSVVADQVARGRAVLQRFLQLSSIPPGLETYVDDLRVKQKDLEEAIGAVDLAGQVRDSALDRIGNEDAALDLQIYDLASMMHLARLNSRKSPFTGYSKLQPSEIVGLAYAKEVSATRELATNILAVLPPPEVTAKVTGCLQQAAKVEKALTALSGPQIEYEQKRAARDQAAMDWSKAYSKLKVRAQVAYEDYPATFKSLFAPPEDVQRPVTRRPKKAEKKTESPAVPE